MRSWFHAAGLDRIDDGEEFAHVDWLGEIVIGADGAQVLDLGGSGVSADHHDAELFRKGISAQLADCKADGTVGPRRNTR